jgi:hypothetical protein
MPAKTVAARKAKGRRLQAWIVSEILKRYPTLTADDVRSTGMGQTGADVQLSTAAKALFPYSIEAKNQEIFTTVYRMYEQAASHGTDEPLLVIKMNNKPPLAIVSATHFMDILNGRKLL